MKKNVMQGIEKIKEDRKIPRKVEKEIFARMVANCALGISMVILIFAFLICGSYLEKTLATKIYNVGAIIFLVFALTVIEIAYKKDSDKGALTSVELLLLSIFTLFAPVIFLKIQYNTIYFTLALIAIYYTIKISKIYITEKNKYLNTLSDITNIIKKESKDELAIQEKEKQKQLAKTKKTSSTRKSTTKKKTTTKTTKKKTTKKEIK